VCGGVTVQVYKAQGLKEHSIVKEMIGKNCVESEIMVKGYKIFFEMNNRYK
jgi:hypothetical protein